MRCARRYDRDISEQQIDDLVRLSGGSPLYITELVRGFQASDLGAQPVSLRSLIEDRIASVSSLAKGVLQATTIFGKYASIDRLEDLLELPAYRLMRALTELDHAGLAEMAEREVRCRHELIADICLDRMPATVATLLHKRGIGNPRIGRAEAGRSGAALAKREALAVGEPEI